MKKVDLTKYIKNPKYGVKDTYKFRTCTKLISRGAQGSSSASYAKHPLANTSNYNKLDIVGISINGKRPGALDINLEEFYLAVKAKVQMFVTDDATNRHRPYNTGERRVANLLTNHKYMELQSSGLWVKVTKI